MATLEKIRNKAGLLVIVVGLALFAFIIGDFLNSGSTYFRQSQEKVLTVNGDVINIQEYQTMVDELSEVYKMQTGSSSLPENINSQIKNAVYQSVLREKLVGEEMEKLGMRVSPEELFDLVQGENISPMIAQNQMFQNPETGQFDKMALLNFLKAIDDDNINAYPADQRGQILQARSYWLYMEKNIKQARAEEKYISLLSKAMSANKLEAEDVFNASSTSSDVAFAFQSYGSVSDSSVTVSRSELEKLYNQRKEDYKQEESKMLKVLAVDIAPSQADYDKVESEIESLKSEFASSDNVAEIVNENSEVPFEDVYFSESTLEPEVVSFVKTADKGDVHGPFFEDDKYRMLKLVDTTVAPDSINVSHIILVGMTEARATELADSLVRELNNNADFAAIAVQYSMDQSAASGGVLGWFNEAGLYRYLGEEFKNAVLSAKKGEIKTVKTTYGTHIVKVTDITKPVSKYKVANIEMTVTPSSSTYSDLYNTLNTFVSNNNTIAKLTENASEAGYDVRDMTVPVTQENLQGITNSRQVIRWAFQNDKGNISDIFECDDKFVIAAIDGSLPEGYASLATVEPALKVELMNQKKGEKIVSELKSKSLNSLDAYASAMNSKVDSIRFVSFNTPFIASVGLEPMFNGVALTTPTNSISEPFAGNNGVYVLKPFNVSKEDAAYNEEEQLRTIDSNRTYTLTQTVIPRLVDKATIIDNRVRFY